MSKTPYTHIGDANTEQAFLTSHEGFDVATLERITPETHPNLPQQHYLRPEEWQQIIDMIDRAPSMEKIIRQIDEKISQGVMPAPCDGFWDDLRTVAADLKRVRYQITA